MGWSRPAARPDRPGGATWITRHDSRPRRGVTSHACPTRYPSRPGVGRGRDELYRFGPTPRRRSSRACSPMCAAGPGRSVGAMPITAIEVHDLHKSYGGRPVLDGVTFAVGEREIFGIAGRNGAGKTTTVEILQGLRRRDAGGVEVLGLDPARDRKRLRRLLGAQLQTSALPDRLRVGEALRLFARLAGDRVDWRDAGDRVAARRPLGQAVRHPLGRAAPAAVPGPDHGQRAAARVPRRAHAGTRSGRAARDVAADRTRPRPGRHRRARHPRHGRGRAPVRPGGGARTTGAW